MHRARWRELPRQRRRRGGAHPHERDRPGQRREGGAALLRGVIRAGRAPSVGTHVHIEGLSRPVLNCIAGHDVLFEDFHPAVISTCPSPTRSAAAKIASELPMHVYVYNPANRHRRNFLSARCPCLCMFALSSAVLLFLGCTPRASQVTVQTTTPAAPSRASTQDSHETSKEQCISEQIPPPVAPKPAPPACAAGDALACEASCSAGDPRSCFRIANRMEYAGSPNDPRVSELFKQSCMMGDFLSCTNFGAHLYKGMGIVEDPICAVKIFERTCSGAEPFGCGMLGSALVTGKGTTRDPARGRQILESSCETAGGFPCSVLGQFHENGSFGTPDPEKARAARARACATGFKRSCSPPGTP